MYHIHCCTIFVLVIGVIFIIVGFPTWMCGCDKTLGGPCIKYNQYSALIISNTCYETHGNGVNGHADDDTIGNNCNVHVEYVHKGVTKVCPIYRSDNDHCRGLVTSMKQTEQCNELNQQDYHLDDYTSIYVGKYNDICYSSHYVSMIAKIGFSFLVIGLVFTICSILYIKFKKYRDTGYSLASNEVTFVFNQL